MVPIRATTVMSQFRPRPWPWLELREYNGLRVLSKYMLAEVLFICRQVRQSVCSSVRSSIASYVLRLTCVRSFVCPSLQNYGYGRNHGCLSPKHGALFDCKGLLYFFPHNQEFRPHLTCRALRFTHGWSPRIESVSFQPAWRFSPQLHQ